ncbi:transposase [Sphingobacterium hungaricum]
MNISKQYVHKKLRLMRKRHAEEEKLTSIIAQVREDHPSMGVRDLYFKIRPESMGRDNFEHFCKARGLMSRKKAFIPKTTNSNGAIRFQNLLADIDPIGIDQVWQSDITYFSLNDRFYYITFILDGFSRRILGHSVSEALSTVETTLPALKMAIKNRGNTLVPGLIFHSDGGGQYYAEKFLCLTEKYHIVNSMCRYPWENGKAERINGVIKNNYLAHRSINTYRQLIKEVDRSVHLYNSSKPHIKLHRHAPLEFEKNIIFDKQNARR